MFRVVSEAVGAEMRKVAVDETWDLPRGPLLEAVRDPSVGVVWLCNPNNPTGRQISQDLVEAVLEAAPHAAVGVDEADYQISSQTLAPRILPARDGVPVRTFANG